MKENKHQKEENVDSKKYNGNKYNKTIRRVEMRQGVSSILLRAPMGDVTGYEHSGAEYSLGLLILLPLFLHPPPFCPLSTGSQKDKTTVFPFEY